MSAGPQHRGRTILLADCFAYFGGLLGAAGGAVGGAIVGAAGTGAAIGAASGAVTGLLAALFRRPTPSPAYTAFVDRCLQERGYETTGWN